MQEMGSLRSAAGEMDLAYSKAWKLIRSLEEEWGFQLLFRQTGGANGGGSSLTEAAEQLLDRYEAMLAEVNLAAEAAFKKYFSE